GACVLIALRGCRDAGGDSAIAGGAEPLLEALARRLGGGPLRVGGHVDPGAVLRADVVALAHPLGRVVALPEHPQQLVVGDVPRTERHKDRLVVTGATAADLFGGGVRREP